MGQYGNQPDFGTRANNITPSGNPSDGLNTLKSAALYIGTGGDLVCSVVGGNTDSYAHEYTIFKNIPNGTFFPVIVTHVYENDENGTSTTCSNIVALY